MRTFDELSKLTSFTERFKYLQLVGEVGTETFGFDRYVNQKFYKSPEWRRVRDFVILRDNGCDLGMQDRPIAGRILIHHMNPIRLNDLVGRSELLLNPDYLICVSHDTHNAIHYGDEKLLIKEPVKRMPGDTCPWKIKME